jgi:hypothetical protein
MSENFWFEETKGAVNTPNSRLVEEAVYELAAARGPHNAAYGQCVAAVKRALADPAENPQHIYRSPAWINARCEKAAANHESYVRNAGRNGGGAQHHDSGAGHAGGNAQNGERQKQQEYRRQQERRNQEEQQKKEDYRKQDENRRRKEQENYERRRAQDELQRQRQQAHTNHTGVPGDSIIRRSDGKVLHCPREGGPCY